MGLPQERPAEGRGEGPVEGLPGRAAFQRDPYIDDGPGGAVGAQGGGAGDEALHVLMENRNGLVVDVVLSQATGTAETEAALTMLERVPTARRITVGADKGYDTREFVTTCRSFEITPHVAMKQRHSPLDRRTSRHAGYAASQRVRKRVEECSAG